jgi:hypothetical protein
VHITCQEAAPKKLDVTTNADRVAYLFELYQRLTRMLPADKMKKKRWEGLFIVVLGR